MCAHIFLTQKVKSRQTWILLTYISVMFILGTLYVASSSKSAELTFIDDRNFPGGPAAFEIVNFSIPINFMGSVVFVIANWLADALMVCILALLNLHISMKSNSSGVVLSFGEICMLS